MSTPYDPHPGPSSKTAQLQQQVNDVVGIMQQNIDSVRDRGEKLDSLQHKTSDLEQGAVQFRRGATGVRRQMWWKNMKWRLIVGTGILIILIIIIVSIVQATK
ncbi:synaptobrevin [Lobosporangium transversale]|uniref:Synaptobrevin n=1 Tax=Lobosporangium transversale TaxID=64571 RepID=A0A1Y2H2M6_9FUNG|nr:synaptobrevin [Lobosporangium transversale]ORZ28796.1 synaptobrevin [Lobosporangium transversale]|eukprot:XP_021886469.1 synaptobrevin [Lobosporangium transversale]